MNIAEAFARMLQGEEIEVTLYGSTQWHGHRLRIVPDPQSRFEGHEWKQMQMQELISGNWYIFRKGSNTLLNANFRARVPLSPTADPTPTEPDLDERLKVLQAEIDEIRAIVRESGE